MAMRLSPSFGPVFYTPMTVKYGFIQLTNQIEPRTKGDENRFCFIQKHFTFYNQIEPRTKGDERLKTKSFSFRSSSMRE